jgi:hypothetical protein
LGATKQLLPKRGDLPSTGRILPWLFFTNLRTLPHHGREFIRGATPVPSACCANFTESFGPGDRQGQKGVYLYDSSGKTYLDLIGGISVANTGHRHPSVVQAIRDQLDKYLHVMVYGELIQSPQVQYATLLAANLPPSLDTVYFTNSGAEATEGAMKLAKRVTGRTEIVAFHNHITALPKAPSVSWGMNIGGMLSGPCCRESSMKSTTPLPRSTRSPPAPPVSSPKRSRPKAASIFRTGNGCNSCAINAARPVHYWSSMRSR